MLSKLAPWHNHTALLRARSHCALIQHIRGARRWYSVPCTSCAAGSEASQTLAGSEADVDLDFKTNGKEPMQRRTFSEAHRVKLRAAWEARRERGLSEETKERMRQAKLGHTTSAATRRKIALGLRGRVVSAETRAKLSARALARWQRHAAAKASQAAERQLTAAEKRRARSGIGELESEWEEQGLSREAAVLELITLRREVGDLVAELSRAGALPETAEEAGLPEALHRKLWRYVWLRNQVRGGAPQG